MFSGFLLSGKSKNIIIQMRNVAKLNEMTMKFSVSLLNS